MAYTKRGSKKAAPKEKTRNPRNPQSDLISNDVYTGPLQTIVGKHRLLVRSSNGKEAYVYVYPAGVEKAKIRHGVNFVRDLGIVKTDIR